MRDKKIKIFKILAVLILLAVLVINSKSIASSARIKFLDVSVLPLKAFSSVSAFVKNIMPFAGLREENRVLRERVNLLTRRLDEMKILYDENDRLKTLLAFRKTIPYQTIPAQVIGRDPTNWSNSLIIDKGIIGGIKQNKAVMSTRGLCGRVLEVGRYSSKILLISDPNSKVGVLIQRNRQGGILTGMPDGRCKIIYIALDSDVAPGDRVITAGFGSIFPKDVLVGEVVKVDKEPGRLYKYAVVKTAEDLSRTEEVLCIR